VVAPAEAARRTNGITSNGIRRECMAASAR
jgi:hypothetical protein